MSERCPAFHWQYQCVFTKGHTAQHRVQMDNGDHHTFDDRPPPPPEPNPSQGPVFFSVAVLWVGFTDTSSQHPGGHRLIATCYTCGVESPAFDYLANSGMPGWLVEHRRSHTAPVMTWCSHIGTCRTPRMPIEHALSDRAESYHVGPCTFDCRNSRCRTDSPHAGDCDLERGR